MVNDFASLGGWINNPQEVSRVLATMPYPYAAQAAYHLKGSSAPRQNALLYLAWKEVNGSYFPYPAQKIGCCVSRGWSEGIDLLECIQIAMGHKNEVFKPTSHEAMYGFARVDIGGQRGSYEDGAVGAWAAKAATTIGTLSQEAVGFDYDDNKAKEWGAKGVPRDLAIKAGDHKLGAASLVTDTDTADDLLANGYPIPICSNRGFTMTRDANGFCRPSGRWDHCMLVCGRRYDIDGYCIMQSWGMNTPDGPLALDQPPNSFWCPKDVMAYILSQQDSYGISAFQGYPGQVIPARWSYAGFA